jgi:hypothetical protein
MAGAGPYHDGADDIEEGDHGGNVSKKRPMA